MSTEIREQFEKTVADHKMSIELDNGVFRCLHFGSPGTGIDHFRLTTWPGHLCISGDMGDYVFSRTRDMFEFFRSDQLQISEAYWAEKCRSDSRFIGMSAYSSERFRQIVTERFEEWAYEHPEHRDEDWSEVEDIVLTYADDGEYAARRAADHFVSEHGFELRDFWEYDLHEYTFQFRWCLYAIVWGIQQYDAARAPAAEGQS